MDKLELELTKRDILGKRVRFLRRQGITPAHLFGHGIESMALQGDTTKLEMLLAQAGKVKLINLKLDKEKNARVVLLSEFQREPMRGKLLHVDFYQVKSKEKVTVEVPIVLLGEAPALESTDTTLMQQFDTLTVECLPAKIPAEIELDISSLTEREQAIRVKDIKLGRGIAILNDPELVVVKISLRLVEKIEEKVKVAEEAVETPVAASPQEESKRE
jgi:large subunit ribosomal protein L25